MKYVEFDETRPMDLVLLGRIAIDFNPAYNDQVKEEFKPLKKVHMFEKFVGGSPAIQFRYIRILLSFGESISVKVSPNFSPFVHFEMREVSIPCSLK